MEPAASRPWVFPGVPFRGWETDYRVRYLSVTTRRGGCASTCPTHWAQEAHRPAGRGLTLLPLALERRRHFVNRLLGSSTSQKSSRWIKRRPVMDRVLLARRPLQRNARRGATRGERLLAVRDSCRVRRRSGANSRSAQSLSLRTQSQARSQSPRAPPRVRAPDGGCPAAAADERQRYRRQGQRFWRSERPIGIGPETVRCSDSWHTLGTVEERTPAHSRAIKNTRPWIQALPDCL